MAWSGTRSGPRWSSRPPRRERRPAVTFFFGGAKLRGMRTLTSWALVAGMAVGISVGGDATADEANGDGEARPAVSALRMSETDLLKGFTQEVRGSRDLRARAIALWRHHFAAQAATLQDRFVREADWRPALADAAALVDEFYEASLLPRAREWPAGEGEVWVEKLDPATGQRTRVLMKRDRRVLLAPGGAKEQQKGETKPERPAPSKGMLAPALP
jgi:hypothetical protein